MDRIRRPRESCDISVYSKFRHFGVWIDTEPMITVQSTDVSFQNRPIEFECSFSYQNLLLVAWVQKSVLGFFFSFLITAFLKTSWLAWAATTKYLMINFARFYALNVLMSNVERKKSLVEYKTTINLFNVILISCTRMYT